MPDFLHSIQGQDLGYLRIVGELWGLELKSNTFDGLAQELAFSIRDPQLWSEVIASLDPDAADALNALSKTGGRIPWTAFVRKFGDIREMGSGRRDREKPYLKPNSSAEVLFYRALLARAFFDTDNGPQEFAYIPDDLLKLVSQSEISNASKRNAGPNTSGIPTVDPVALGHPAVPSEKAHIFLSTDYILDDATTLLAALRVGQDINPDPILQNLLHAAGLLRKNIPRTEKIKAFLEVPRFQALDDLVAGWRASDIFNELRLVPGLLFEGSWTNSPLETRNVLLGFLASIPDNTWWSLNGFINDVKQKHPDFQRPAGDYDSWFIKRQSDNQYLRGFTHWDEVDGALIRFFITSILYRLGRLDLAGSQDGSNYSAFRLKPPGSKISKNETGKLKISSGGMLSVPRSTPRAVRYQIARFCQSEEEKLDEYRYRLTTASLVRSQGQGLSIEQILALLSRHAAAGIPPVLVKALKRWELDGTLARLETQVILTVKKPEVLAQLRKSRAARFLGQSLGTTTVVIKSGAQSRVLAALAELGYFAEDVSVESPAAHKKA